VIVSAVTWAFRIWAPLLTHYESDPVTSSSCISDYKRMCISFKLSQDYTENESLEGQI
jgi:hypothetical protein